MDLDAYVGAHEGEWRELEQLVAHRKLDAVQADRLIELYQRVGTHLSVLRSAAPDPTLILALSNLLAKARRRTGGVRNTTWQNIGRFFTRTFPATIYRIRWWWVGSALLTVIIAAIFALWLISDPSREANIAAPNYIKDMVEHKFENYYSTYDASHFGLQVWTNNAFVSAKCIAFGVIGFPVLDALFQNAKMLGIWLGLMTNHGRAGLFWGLILPHGLLEFTAIFIAGGAGLRLFWSWVKPQQRTRMSAMAKEGRTTIVTALGLVLVLAIAGILEAFITPAHLPTLVRVGIGFTVWLLFMCYVFIVGRRAYRAGEDGDIAAHDRGDEMIYAD